MTDLPVGVTIDPAADVATTVLLGAPLEIGARAVVGQGVVFAGGESEPTRVMADVSIAAGAVIGPNVTLGRGAHVRPGAVVLSSVPPNAVVSGNPAQIVGYTNETGTPARLAVSERLDASRREIEIEALGVGGSAVYRMPKVVDLRGNLTVGEFGKGLPFKPERYFVVFEVPSEELRGEHAHFECAQFLICVQGTCHALVDDGTTRREVVLDRPDIGLYMPPMIWGTQYRYSKDAVLFVFASHGYDTNDYIRTYDAFHQEVARRTS